MQIQLNFSCVDDANDLRDALANKFASKFYVDQPDRYVPNWVITIRADCTASATELAIYSIFSEGFIAGRKSRERS